MFGNLSKKMAKKHGYTRRAKPSKVYAVGQSVRVNGIHQGTEWVEVVVVHEDGMLTVKTQAGTERRVFVTEIV